MLAMARGQAAAMDAMEFSVMRNRSLWEGVPSVWVFFALGLLMSSMDSIACGVWDRVAAKCSSGRIEFDPGTGVKAIEASEGHFSS